MTAVSIAMLMNSITALGAGEACGIDGVINKYLNEPQSPQAEKPTAPPLSESTTGTKKVDYVKAAASIKRTPDHLVLNADHLNSASAEKNIFFNSTDTAMMTSDERLVYRAYQERRMQSESALSKPGIQDYVKKPFSAADEPKSIIPRPEQMDDWSNQNLWRVGRQQAGKEGLTHEQYMLSDMPGLEGVGIQRNTGNVLNKNTYSELLNGKEVLSGGKLKEIVGEPNSYVVFRDEALSFGADRKGFKASHINLGGGEEAPAAGDFRVLTRFDANGDAHTTVQFNLQSDTYWVPTSPDAVRAFIQSFEKQGIRPSTFEFLDWRTGKHLSDQKVLLSVPMRP